jgi:hypothetical protein
MGKGNREYKTVLQDALDAATRSWTATDTLYASLCAAGIGAGSWLSVETNPQGLLSLAILVVALSASWIMLIRRYRRKIKKLLADLKKVNIDNDDLHRYYESTSCEFAKERRDYLAPAVPLLAVTAWAIIFVCYN